MVLFGPSKSIPATLGLDLNRSEIGWLRSEAAGSPVFSSHSSAKQKKPAHDEVGPMPSRLVILELLQLGFDCQGSSQFFYLLTDRSE
jgi:hypothetical protein